MVRRWLPEEGGLGHSVFSRGLGTSIHAPLASPVSLAKAERSKPVGTVRGGSGPRKLVKCSSDPRSDTREIGGSAQ